MGWKSTHCLTRSEAIQLILDFMDNIDTLTNLEMESVLGAMYGDSTDRPYHGCNFSVFDENPNDF